MIKPGARFFYPFPILKNLKQKHLDPPAPGGITIFTEEKIL